MLQPPMIAAPRIGYSLALLSVLLLTVVLAAAVANDEQARRAAYLRSPLRNDTQHCSEHHGRVVRDQSGSAHCQIFVL